MYPTRVGFSAYLEVCGDILLWQRKITESTIQVWNWKTGQLIWVRCDHITFSIQPTYHSYCQGYHLLPDNPRPLTIQAFLMGYQNSLIIVQDDSICVVRMDPNVVNSEPGNLQPSVADINAEACLRLMFYPSPRWPPFWSFNLSVDYEAHMHRPSYPLGRRPLFEVDPALTVLTIRRRSGTAPSGGDSQILIVPVSTISSFMPAPSAHVAPSSSSNKHVPAIIPFDDWAKRGDTVTVPAPGRTLCLGALGSQCGFVGHVRKKGYEGFSMLLVDAHPGARYDPHEEFHLAPVETDSSRPAGATLAVSYSVNRGNATALPYKRTLVEMPVYSGYESVVSLDLFPDQCVFRFKQVSGTDLFPVIVDPDTNYRVPIVGVRCFHKTHGRSTFENQAHGYQQIIPWRTKVLHATISYRATHARSYTLYDISNSRSNRWSRRELPDPQQSPTIIHCCVLA